MATSNFDFDAGYDDIFDKRNDNENTLSNKSVSAENIVAGLDIGTTKVACVVGRKTADGKIEILGFGRTDSKSVSQGLVMDINETVESIKEAVAIAKEQIGEGLDISKVTVGIAGQHITSIQHHGMCRRNNPSTEITSEEVEKLRKEAYKTEVKPGEEIIDVIMQDVLLDGNPVNNPVGMFGSKLEVDFLVIKSKQSIRNLIRCVEKAGLEVGKVTLSSIASSQAVLTEEEKNSGVALVDIGGGTTDIAIFHDNKLYHTASIPMGGELITKDIMAGYGTIHKYAEKAKVKYGSALESKYRPDELLSIPGTNGHAPKEIQLTALSAIIEGRLTEIFFAVNSQLQTHKELPLDGGIVLTGGSSQMKDIADLMECITSVDILMKHIARTDVRIGSPIINKRFTCDESMKDRLSNPAMSTCVGLLLESAKQTNRPGEEPKGNANVMQNTTENGETESALKETEKSGNVLFGWLKGLFKS